MRKHNANTCQMTLLPVILFSKVHKHQVMFLNIKYSFRLKIIPIINGIQLLFQTVIKKVTFVFSLINCDLAARLVKPFVTIEVRYLSLFRYPDKSVSTISFRVAVKLFITWQWNRIQYNVSFLISNPQLD